MNMIISAEKNARQQEEKSSSAGSDVSSRYKRDVLQNGYILHPINLEEREIEIVNRDRQNLAASGVRKRLAGR